MHNVNETATFVALLNDYIRTLEKGLSLAQKEITDLKKASFLKQVDNEKKDVVIECYQELLYKAQEKILLLRDRRNKYRDEAEISYQQIIAYDIEVRSLKQTIKLLEGKLNTLKQSPSPLYGSPGDSEWRYKGEEHG